MAIVFAAASATGFGAAAVGAVLLAYRARTRSLW
jgi:hypothetical protein